jgi:hypothetical protein
MFSRRRREPDVVPENTAGRLGQVLAQPGPHDQRIGHTQTQAGNTDPHRRGLALCRSAGLLHSAAGRRTRLLRLAQADSPHPSEAVPEAVEPFQMAGRR